MRLPCTHLRCTDGRRMRCTCRRALHQPPCHASTVYTSRVYRRAPHEPPSNTTRWRRRWIHKSNECEFRGTRDRMADGWPDDPQLVKPNEGNEIILYIGILYPGNSRRCSAKCACIPVRDHAGMHVQDRRACACKMAERVFACGNACSRMRTSICICMHGRVCELSPTCHGSSEGSSLPFTSAVDPPALVFRPLIRPL